MINDVEYVNAITGAWGNKSNNIKLANDTSNISITHISNDRMNELYTADQEGRIIILPTKRDAQVLAINEALSINLYDWQIAYIFGSSDYIMPGRGTGKTLAHILRTLLSDGDAIKFYGDYKYEFIDMAGAHPGYITWYKREFQEVEYRLRNYGAPLKLRKVYYLESAYKKDMEKQL